MVKYYGRLLRGAWYGVLALATIIPIPEPFFLFPHQKIEHALHVGPVVPYLLALAASMVSLSIEFFLIGKLDKKIHPVVYRWLLEHAQAWFNSNFPVVVSASIIVCSLNPFPIFPATRTTAILIHRETEAQAGWLICAMTALRLLGIYLGILFFLR